MVNLTGSGSAVSAGLGGTVATVTGGGLGTVSLPGIATLNLNAGAGDITLAGTAGPDAFTVTPTGPNAATAQVGALAPVVNTTNTGTSKLNVDGGAGSNVLTVDGTSGPDAINVSGTSVAVAGLKPVQFAEIASLQVNGLAGADTFNVSPSTTVPIGIDGGDPASVLPGDQLNVVTNPGAIATFIPGSAGDQGAFVVDSDLPITFARIESLSVVGGGSTVLDGTSGNDAIAITARDGSYAATADGIQDFTATINGGPTFLFINTPSVIVDGLAGSNQFAIQAPAPTSPPGTWPSRWTAARRREIS